MEDLSKRYDEDYFMRGKETGKSLYTCYTWMPELTKPMVCAMVSYLGIKPDDKVLDFGCARGYTVRALYEMGYDAWGVDCSEWALENCDESVKGRVSDTAREQFDWIIAKDVLEHIGGVRSPLISEVVNLLKGKSRKGVFAVVPLAHGKRYDVPEYEADVTHVHRQPIHWWTRLFCEPGWSVDARYRVPGVKDNYKQYKTGNAFITARRLIDE